MQRLTAPPRESLTDQQVLDLLHTDALRVSAGCELLGADLTVLADISDDLVDGAVERVMAATIHGTVRLTLTRDAEWGTQLVRPYLVLTDVLRDVTARFNVGVYVLVTPEDVFGQEPRAYAVQGYDRLYLLDRPVGDTYVVAAGTDYLTAVRSAIIAAGLTGVLLDGTASGSALPTAAVWLFLPEGGAAGGTTWLNVVNDLLAAVGYRGLWVDENGLYRSEPYANPSARPVEWSLDADAGDTLVGQDRTRVADQWKQPNRWVFVQRNRAGDPPPEPVEGTGVYTVPNATGALTWTKTVELDAADQAALVAQGDQIVAADRRRTELLCVTTGPLPILGHADVITYSDIALGAPRKTQAVRWTLPLNGGDCTLELEVVA